MKIDQRKISPMMLITLCVMVGIVVANHWGELWASPVFWIIGAICIAGAAWWDVARRQAIGVVALMLIACGAVLDTVQHQAQDTTPPLDTTITWSVESLTEPQTKGRYTRLTALATAIKDTTGIWRPSNIKIELNIDTSLRISPRRGNKIALRGKLRSVDGSYGEWLARQGIVGKVYTYGASITDSSTTPLTLTNRVAATRGDMARRIEEIDTNQRAATAIMCALALGERTMMPRELKTEYRRSGAAHLLAISGLHVGIIVVIVNMMFNFLRLWRRGRIVFGCVVIVLMWSYAIFTGMSPSVVRAVTMFSLYQIGMMSSRSSDKISVLAASALMLLMVDTRYLTDVGFQLSFMAMLGIITLFGPVGSLVQTRNRVVQFFWTLTVVSITAQVAVAPLVAYYFGQVALLGIVVNILVWGTVPVIIVSTALFLASGWTWVANIGIWTAIFQNYIVAGVASPRWATIENIELNIWWLLLTYTCLTAIVITINRLYNKKIRTSILRNKYRI